MMSERTIKRIVFYGLIPSMILAAIAVAMPTGTAQTVLAGIALFGTFGSGMAVSYNALIRTNRCP